MNQNEAIRLAEEPFRTGRFFATASCELQLPSLVPKTEE
jgi:hypothetical protein